MFRIGRRKNQKLEKFPGLDAFERAAVIQEGTKSVLYRVVERDQQAEYCLKILKESSAEIADKLRRIGMNWEGDWNMAFDHPHIVVTHFSGKEGNTYFLLLEYLSGQSLLHHIHFEPRKLNGRRLEIAITMAETIAYMHTNQCIHRDICPKNFMFNGEDVLKLIDFGVCISTLDRVLNRGGVTGTPSYMAPEIVVSKRYSTLTDIYALGISYYELFASKKPFFGEDANARMMQHLNVDAAPPRQIEPRIPPALEIVILKAMEKKYQDRYQDVRQLLQDLQKLEGEVAL